MHVPGSIEKGHEDKGYDVMGTHGSTAVEPDATGTAGTLGVQPGQESLKSGRSSFDLKEARCDDWRPIEERNCLHS